MTKSNGSSAPESDLTSSSPPPEPSIARCEHADAAGRRCRMPRCDTHPSLCQNHAREELLKFQNRENFAPELLGPIKDFQTASAINHALGRIFVLLGANRIHTRQAAVLAYICQLMLQSLDGVKREVGNVVDSDFTEKELFRVIDSLPALDPKLARPRGANGKP
jgi:hypothetical protein